MASALTRGPLPASVYWRRRAVLFGVVLVVVLLVASLLGGDDQPAGSGDRASQAAAEPRDRKEPRDKPTADRTRTAEDRARARERRRERLQEQQQPTDPVPETPFLRPPDGPCEPEDIVVTPTVPVAIAYRDVTISLSLRTNTAEACTWELSGETLAVKVTSGDDDIWSSQQCPRSLAMRDLVLRRDIVTPVPLIWNARRSDTDCPGRTDWALPGYYYVAAAALGGEPDDVQFRLVKPQPRVLPPQPTNPRDPERRPGRGRHHEDKPKLR